MSKLIIPETKPPQLTTDVEQHVVAEMFAEGFDSLLSRGMESLGGKHEAFGHFLDEFGWSLNDVYNEGPWPDRTLKVGASIAINAYEMAGYEHTIDEAHIALGSMAAVQEGVPEAYDLSLLGDMSLRSLIQTTASLPRFADYGYLPSDSGGFLQVMGLGAGCVRFYLQQAVELD